MTSESCPALDPTGADLHGEAARLRARGPATLVQLPGNVRAWSVTRYDVIKRLAADRRVSRDPRRHWPGLANVPEDWPLAFWVGVKNAFTSYGSEHRRLRALISAAFTPRRTEALRPLVLEHVARAIRELEAVPPGEVTDLRRNFAYVIPTEVICDLFGVPADLRGWTLRVLDTLLGTTTTPENAKGEFEDLMACMAALIAAKRARPGEDMTSDLIAARDGEGALDEEELVATLILMTGAGGQTAVNLLARTALALLTHPGQLSLVREGTLSRHDVIQETLRLEGPVMHMPLRYAVEDIDLGEGVRIGRGDAILLAFGAAGRDPALHGESGCRFDATRPVKEHLAFGHGVHYCVGAPLALMEADIALRELFGRFPGMALAVPENQLRPQESFIENGHQELPVILAPAGAVPESSRRGSA